MLGDVLLKKAGPPPPRTGTGEMPGAVVCAPNAAKLPIVGVVVCIASGGICCCGENEFICVIVGFCTLSAFIDNAGAFVLFALPESKLSKSIFRSPAFRLSDQVEPTCTVVLADDELLTPEEPADNGGCKLLLALTGCSRLLPVLAIGGRILSKKEIKNKI